MLGIPMKSPGGGGRRWGQPSLVMINAPTFLAPPGGTTEMPASLHPWQPEGPFCACIYTHCFVFAHWVVVLA